MCPSRSNAAVRSRSQAGKSPIAFLKPDFYMAAVFSATPLPVRLQDGKTAQDNSCSFREINYLPQARSMYNSG